MRTSLDRPAWAGALALTLYLLAVAPAAASTYTPTRFDDPPPGKCKPSDCSLREALRAANEEAGRDSIVLRKGTYEIEIPAVVGDLGPDNGDLDIYTPLTIRGAGQKQTKIDANGLDRVFYFNDQSPEAKRTTLRSLTVKGGDATAVADVQHPAIGGGIFLTNPSAKMTLKDVAVRQNEASLGGGIRSQALGLKIVKSTISQNAAAEGGGLQLPVRLYSQPITMISSSTISNNSALKGGGILADGSGASATLKLPFLHVVNSTVAANHTSAEAGGIMADNNATVDVYNSTVAYNAADDDNTGGGVGGGIHQHSGAEFVIADSVVAANTAGTSGSGYQCDGMFSDNGSVVDISVGTNPSCSWATAPVFTATPGIGPLADNGGPTKTVKLLSGSPAIGNAVVCLPRDQRGVKRPKQGCDSGSYERKRP